jgi:hypothetical protein
MKHFLNNIICIALFFTYNSMSGQDRIITVNNDTIECRILSISSARINYEQDAGDYTVGKFIPVSEVSSYYKGVARNSGSPQTGRQSERQNPSLSARWLSEVRFGGAYLTSSTAGEESDLINSGISEDDAKDYSKKYRHGIHLDAKICYIPEIFDGNINLGVGVKYKFFTFSSNIDEMIKSPYKDMAYVMPFIDLMNFQFLANNRVYLNYAGVVFVARQWLDTKRRFNLMCDVSAGYLYYRHEVSVSSGLYMFIGLPPTISALETGHTIGADFGLTFAYHPLERLAITAGANFFVAKLKNMDTRISDASVEMAEPTPINLSNLNYAIGLRFNF